MNNVMTALLNMILVSIPENIFIVVMTLIFLKRFDLLDFRMWKQNLKWIMIPSISIAIMINMFKYIIVIPRPITSLSCLVIMNILILYIVLRNTYEVNKKLIFKISIATFMSFVAVSLIELIYVPMSLSLLHRPISYFNNNIVYNFLLALPGRIMEICLIAFILIRKNNSIKINLFDAIIKNNFYKLNFLFMIILINLIIVYIAKLIMIDNILVNIEIIEQLFITILIVSIPIILITWFFIFVNYSLTREKRMHQTYESLVIQDDIADVNN